MTRQDTQKSGPVSGSTSLRSPEPVPVSALPGNDPGYWRPIETAPMDGTAIQAEIPGHGSDNVIAFHMGLVNSNDEECGGWCFVEDQEPPDCWTDGWCWEVNEDGERSVQPTRWKPLPPISEEANNERPE